MSESLTAENVASYLIALASKPGSDGEVTGLTQMHVHKLLYLVQAWHLGVFGTPAFDDEIQAWKHGPVVVSVRKRFRKYGKEPIAASEGQLDALNDESHRTFVEQVWSKYNVYSAAGLRNLTHDDQSYKHARNGLREDQESSNPISLQTLKQEYAARVAKRRSSIGLTEEIVRTIKGESASREGLKVLDLTAARARRRAKHEGFAGPESSA